jgi:hypothetical protein
VSASVFEQMFQLFMARGGFAQPCVSETFEREARQTKRHVPKPCAHGKTALSCSECWLSGFERGNAI